MFKFLKDKLKAAVGLFSKKVDAEAEEKVIEQEVPVKKEAPVEKEAPKKEISHKKETAPSHPAKAPEKKKETKEKKKEEPLSEDTKKEQVKHAEKKKETHGEKKPKYAKTIEEDLEELKKEMDVDDVIAEADELEEEMPHYVEETEKKAEEEFSDRKGTLSDAEKAAHDATPLKEEASVSQEGPAPGSLADKKGTKEDPKKEKKGFFSKLFGKKEKVEEKKEVVVEQPVEKKSPLKKEASVPEAVKEPEVTPSEEEAPAEEEPTVEITDEETETQIEEEEEKAPVFEKPFKKEKTEEPEKLGFFGRLKQKIVTKTISDEKFEELFFELEVALLENNCALEVVDKIKADLKKELVGVPILRGKVDETILLTLKESIEGLFSVPTFDLVQRAKKKKPFVIAFVGVNGSGKTTTIAKVAHYLKKNKLSSVISASDTFRAAAIDQLGKHAEKLGIKMIKHDYGSDPAAVAFDAISYAKAHNIDVVLVDTAGRQHSDANLMDELKKIKRVANPDVTLFIGESITGNDCVEQARQFNAAVELDGIILSKADVDEKGGAAISVSYVTGKPILFLGTGQTYDDLTPFSKEFIMQHVGL